MPIDDDKLAVYSIIMDMVLKLIFGLIAAGILIALVRSLIADPNYPVSIVTTVFGCTVTHCYKHYFPASISPHR